VTCIGCASSLTLWSPTSLLVYRPATLWGHLHSIVSVYSNTDVQLFGVADRLVKAAVAPVDSATLPLVVALPTSRTAGCVSGTCWRPAHARAGHRLMVSSAGTVSAVDWPTCDTPFAEFTVQHLLWSGPPCRTLQFLSAAGDVEHWAATTEAGILRASSSGGLGPVNQDGSGMLEMGELRRTNSAEHHLGGGRLMQSIAAVGLLHKTRALPPINQLLTATGPTNNPASARGGILTANNGSASPAAPGAPLAVTSGGVGSGSNSAQSHSGNRRAGGGGGGSNSGGYGSGVASSTGSSRDASLSPRSRSPRSPRSVRQ
jgi:hypothetical protein